MLHTQARLGNTPDSLGELPALIVAHVALGSSHKPKPTGCFSGLRMEDCCIQVANTPDSPIQLAALIVVHIASRSPHKPESTGCNHYLRGKLFQGRIELVNTPDSLCELPALIVAHIAWRGSNEPGHAVLLHVLAHVQAHHGPLGVEQVHGQGPGELGFPDPRGSQEHEAGYRTLRV